VLVIDSSDGHGYETISCEIGLNVACSLRVVFVMLRDLSVNVYPSNGQVKLLQ